MKLLFVLPLLALAACAASPEACSTARIAEALAQKYAADHPADSNAALAATGATAARAEACAAPPL